MVYLSLLLESCKSYGIRGRIMDIEKEAWIAVARPVKKGVNRAKKHRVMVR
jgi:hypothetical protein